MKRLHVTNRKKITKNIQENRAKRELALEELQ